jgi:hypothetical protein
MLSKGAGPVRAAIDYESPVTWHARSQARGKAAPRDDSRARRERRRCRRIVFVGFSDDRRLALVVRFGVVVFVLVIIIVIVGVSRRHRVAHDGDESPLGRGKVLRDALGHVGSLMDFATFMRGCYRAGPRSSKRAPTRQGAAAGAAGRTGNY